MKLPEGQGANLSVSIQLAGGEVHVSFARFVERVSVVVSFVASLLLVDLQLRSAVDF